MNSSETVSNSLNRPTGTVLKQWMYECMKKWINEWIAQSEDLRQPPHWHSSKAMNVCMYEEMNEWMIISETAY